MNIAAKVAADKQKHPERFCPAHRCLWRVTQLDHATQTHSVRANCPGGYCPRHQHLRPVTPALESHQEAIMAKPKKKSKPNTNAEGDPTTFYLSADQKNKLKRLAERRSVEIQAPVSLSNMLRVIIDGLPEPGTEVPA